jgi:phosphinothricin acetyltransferase
MRSRIERTLLTHPWLVDERDGAILAYAYASELRTRAAYRWSTESSVYVAEPAQGRGLGRALYAALLGVLARQRFVAVFAGITLPNAPSVRLHESLGFVPVGSLPRVGFKHGAWHDVGFWRLQLRQESSPHEDPIRFAALDPDEVGALMTISR